MHGTWRAGGAGAGIGAAGFRRKEPVGFLKRLTRMKKVCSVSGVTDGEGVEEWSLFLEQREGQEEKAIWSKMVVSEVLDPGIWRRGTG